MASCVTRKPISIQHTVRISERGKKKCPSSSSRCSPRSNMCERRRWVTERSRAEPSLALAWDNLVSFVVATTDSRQSIQKRSPNPHGLRGGMSTQTTVTKITQWLRGRCNVVDTGRGFVLLTCPNTVLALAAFWCKKAVQELLEFNNPADGRSVGPRTGH